MSTSNDWDMYRRRLRAEWTRLPHPNQGGGYDSGDEYTAADYERTLKEELAKIFRDYVADYAARPRDTKLAVRRIWADNINKFREEAFRTLSEHQRRRFGGLIEAEFDRAQGELKREWGLAAGAPRA